jgi:hypothetical protein
MAGRRRAEEAPSTAAGRPAPAEVTLRSRLRRARRDLSGATASHVLRALHEAGTFAAFTERAATLERRPVGSLSPADLDVLLELTELAARARELAQKVGAPSSDEPN